MQSHREAALWNDVLGHIEAALALPPGTIKVTVLIETLPAVFEMDEILWALRTRITGLNCGRWDYIFSYIKTLRAHRDRVLPERGQVAMTVPFLKAYSELLIKTCHRRGAFAMGGMAAQIPINNDPAANEAALAKVRADKLREVTAGHDGTWVAHPALVPIAREIFDAHMPTPNQLHVLRADVHATRDDIARALRRHDHARRIRRQCRSLPALSRRVARRSGLRADPSPDGRRGDRRDLAHAALAMAARRRSAFWPTATHRSTFRCSTQRSRPCACVLPRSPMPGQARVARAAELLGELTHARTLADFLTLAAYPELP